MFFLISNLQCYVLATTASKPCHLMAKNKYRDIALLSSILTT